MAQAKHGPATDSAANSWFSLWISFGQTNNCGTDTTAFPAAEQRQRKNTRSVRFDAKKRIVRRNRKTRRVAGKWCRVAVNANYISRWQRDSVHLPHLVRLAYLHFLLRSFGCILFIRLVFTLWLHAIQRVRSGRASFSLHWQWWWCLFYGLPFPIRVEHHFFCAYSGNFSDTNQTQSAKLRIALHLALDHGKSILFGWVFILFATPALMLCIQYPTSSHEWQEKQKQTRRRANWRAATQRVKRHTPPPPQPQCSEWDAGAFPPICTMANDKNHTMTCRRNYESSSRIVRLQCRLWFYAQLPRQLAAMVWPFSLRIMALAVWACVSSILL